MYDDDSSKRYAVYVSHFTTCTVYIVVQPYYITR